MLIFCVSTFEINAKAIFKHKLGFFMSAVSVSPLRTEIYDAKSIVVSDQIVRVHESSSINKQIDNFFTRAQNVTSKEFKVEAVILSDFLKRSFIYLDHVHVLTLMYRCSKKSMSIDTIIDWNDIIEILKRPTSKFDARSLSIALYCLQDISSDKLSIITSYIKALCMHLRKSKISSLNGQAIGMSLYGLQKTNCNMPEALELLMMLAPLIYDRGDGEDASRYNSVRWKANLPPTPPATGIISSRRIYPVHMTAQEISNALYGLQGHTSESVAVKSVMKALTARIKKSVSTAKFTAQHVSMALFGLQRMNSDDQEVVELLQAILPFIRSVPLDHQAIANSFYGEINSDLL